MVAVRALGLLPVGCASCVDQESYGRPWSGRPTPPQTGPEVLNEQPSSGNQPY